MTSAAGGLLLVGCGKMGGALLSGWIEAGRSPATITVVDSVFDSASGTFGVRLDLPNRDKTVPAGVRCKVEFPSLKGLEPRPQKTK